MQSAPPLELTTIPSQSSVWHVEQRPTGCCGIRNLRNGLAIFTSHLLGRHVAARASCSNLASRAFTRLDSFILSMRSLRPGPLTSCYRVATSVLRTRQGLVPVRLRRARANHTRIEPGLGGERWRRGRLALGEGCQALGGDRKGQVSAGRTGEPASGPPRARPSGIMTSGGDGGLRWSATSRRLSPSVAPALMSNNSLGHEYAAGRSRPYLLSRPDFGAWTLPRCPGRCVAVWERTSGV